ncbi:hypothetical protein PG985_006528 [Apiospora marii]|uniref:Uncharacterized protein n=1 Tax=Apiospora marii TaxID=335849 RepID=A0ABR1S7V7_9PEZI
MILANDTYPTHQTRLINPAPSKEQQQQASRCLASSSQAASAVSTTISTTRTRVRTGSLLPYFLHPATAASMATTKTTTLTITSSTAIPSPPPRGALRRAPSPSSPGSSSSRSDAASSSPKKSATFCADLARDLQTGELVPPQTGDGTGAEYRAWFRARRQVEQRRQSVREQADRDFDHAMQRLIFVVAR